MKRNTYPTKRPIIYLILPALCLCGFLFGWLEGMHGPVLPTLGIQLSESQAIWSRFIGYSQPSHLCEFSTLTQDKALIIAKQAKRILAIEANSGYIRWDKRSQYTLTSPATTHGKRIFITTEEPRLLAFDVNTGKVVWSVQLPHIVRAKAAANQDQVIVKTVIGEVLAFNASNGKPLWHSKHNAPNMALHPSSTPQLNQDTLCVGFSDGKVLALNPLDGKVIWEHTVAQVETGTEFDKLVDIAADPVIDQENALVYVSAYHGKLTCLALTTGDVKWERDFSNHMPLVLGKDLYGIDEHNVVYAFNKLNGSILWEQNTFKEYQNISNDYKIIGPTLTAKGDQLLLGDQEGNVYWLSCQDGSLVGKASFHIASPILGGLLTQGDTVYVMNQRSQIAAWKHPLILPIASTIDTLATDPVQDEKLVLEESIQETV